MHLQFIWGEPSALCGIHFGKILWKEEEKQISKGQMVRWPIGPLADSCEGGRDKAVPTKEMEPLAFSSLDTGTSQPIASVLTLSSKSPSDSLSST